jgi:hypothetical protein
MGRRTTDLVAQKGITLIMAWEQRSNGRRYFYRVERVDGRVVKTYFGAGPAASVAADRVAGERAARAEADAALRAERERVRPVERAVEALAAGTDLALAAALMAAGFHQHDRGAWRRKRVPIGE